MHIVRNDCHHFGTTKGTDELHSKPGSWRSESVELIAYQCILLLNWEPAKVRQARFIWDLLHAPDLMGSRISDIRGQMTRPRSRLLERYTAEISRNVMADINNRIHVQSEAKHWPDWTKLMHGT